MKKIFVFLFFIIFMQYVMSAQTSPVITTNWIKAKISFKLKIKGSGSKTVDNDKNSLSYINKSTIPENLEGELNELLYHIIVDNLDLNTENSTSALDILQNKYKNKKFFFNTSTDIAFHYSTKNPFVIAKIFKGLKELMESNFDLSVSSFKIVFQNIKTPYVISSFEGSPKYGTEVIVTEIIAYIREYIKLTRSAKVQEKPEQAIVISEIYTELNIEKSNFNKLNGAKELVAEF